MLKYNIGEVLELSRDIRTREARWTVASTLRQSGTVNGIDETVICLAYLALIIKNTEAGNYEYPDLELTLGYVEDEEVREYIRSKISEELFENCLLDISCKFENDQLIGIVFSNEFDGYENNSTPNSIISLAIKLLGIDESVDTDKKMSGVVADICCGTSSFLLRSSESNPSCKYYGCDINTNAYGISKIRASLVNGNSDIELNDAFKLMEDDRKFDCIFMNHPFGMRIRQMKNEDSYINLFSNLIPKMSPGTSCDWLFALLGLKKLKENGKLAVVVTNSCLYNVLDSKVREYMVKNKLIESVIELPSNMFVGTGVSTSVVVFSKKNNERISFVNATKFFEKGRRQNQFTDENINQILDNIRKDSEYSVSLDISDINEDGYQLNPLRYIDAKETEFKDGVPFESVVLNVFRGAPLRARELDEFASNEENDCQYIMLSNIKDGVIDKDLPYLSSISEKYEKYCIKNRSLLVSKNGAPFKTAVAEIEEGRKVLANGNLYVFELDEQKVNPYYLQAFFASDAGQKLLSKFVVGSTIPNLPLQDFKKAVIPLPPMEIQNKIADEYAATIDEINVIKMKLERAKRKLKESFDKGREG